MEIVEYAVGGILLVAGVLIIGTSYARQIDNFRHRNDPDRGWSSPAPFVGPVLFLVGYSQVPLDFTPWLLLVFLVDPDTLLTLISIPWFFKGLRS